MSTDHDQLLEQGFRLFQQNQLQQAELSCREVLAANPNHDRALYLLAAIACKVGQFAPAIELFHRAVQISPGVAGYHLDLGLALNAVGRYEEAEKHTRIALSLNPSLSAAHNNLGSILHSLGRFGESMSALEAAVRLDPTNPFALSNLGASQAAYGELSAALVSHQRAVQLAPTAVMTRNNLAETYLKCGQIRNAIDVHAKTVELCPDVPGAWDNLLFALLYDPKHSAADIAGLQKKWHDRIIAKIARLPNRSTRPACGRRLKIGYVSADLHQHPVAIFFEPLLRHHDRNRFEIFIYRNFHHADHVTNRLREMADHWREIYKLSDDEVAALIRRHEIDILVDLSAHTAANRLLVFARKPAPLQMTYLAYCTSTGLEAIDYRITDDVVDPIGAEDFGTEQLLRLPRVFCAYEPPAEDLPVGPLPALKRKRVTFGAMCTLSKINEDVLSVWCDVLNAVDQSQLVLRARGLSDAGFRKHFEEIFAQRGIGPTRVVMHEFTSYKSYLSSFEQIDIGLDPFPFSSHTTNCHSIWMGVPVITLAGPAPISRVTSSILTAVGLSRLVADTPQQYVELARKLAADLPALAELRASMRERVQRSALLDHVGLARAIEEAFLRSWEKLTAAS